MYTPEKIPLLIVDDHDWILQGLISNLEKRFPGKYHFFTAENVNWALQILREKKIEILITDIALPDATGLVLAKIVKAKYPEITIIAITGSEQYCDMDELLKMRDISIISKLHDSKEELFQLLNSPIGTVRISREINTLLAQNQEQIKINKEFNGLSPIEKKILALLVKGKTKKEIAAELKMTTRNVDRRQESLETKFKVKTLAELIATVSRLKLLD